MGRKPGLITICSLVCSFIAMPLLYFSSQDHSSSACTYLQSRDPLLTLSSCSCPPTYPEDRKAPVCRRACCPSYRVILLQNGSLYSASTNLVGSWITFLQDDPL